MMKKNLFSTYGVDTGKFTHLAHAIRESRAIKADYEKNKKLILDVVKPPPPATETMSLADRVILAGKRRRNEVPTEDQLTDLSPNAADSPAVANAKLILLSGMRRRGEIE
jgi:hypothetical protein